MGELWIFEFSTRAPTAGTASGMGKKTQSKGAVKGMSLAEMEMKRQLDELKAKQVR